MDFARGYDKALEMRMKAEQYADFQNFNGTPVLKTEYNIEDQMSKLFTMNVFLEFHKELEGSLRYFAESKRSEGEVKNWQVYRFEERSGTRPCLSPAHINPANPHGFVPAQRKPNWPKPTGRLPLLPRASMLSNGVAERTSSSVTHPGTTPIRARLTTKFSPLPSPLEDHSSGDGSGENLVVKRARMRVVTGWVTELEVLSATPLGSIEARGNGGRHPVGLGQLGFRCAGTNP
ncbi:hypothetical protein ACLOJK_028648 [Asimina triloba]